MGYAVKILWRQGQARPLFGIGYTGPILRGGKLGMKVFMLWGMEGASGIYAREHLWYWEEGVRAEMAEEGRRLLTADVNSAAAAALRVSVVKWIVGTGLQMPLQ
jgi:hypothetical protein